MSFWYKIRTSFSSSSSSFVSILNAFHTPMKDCDGYDSISNELYVGMTSNMYFVASCLTYYSGGYGTYIRSRNNNILLNGYPLIIKTLNQVNSNNYDALVPLETSFISGKYVIPENIPSSAPNNLQRGTIPVTYSIDSKEYMYMFFAGESNPPWVNSSYTNKTVVRTWGGYNIPSNTNTPGSNYPDDNAIFSDSGIIGDEYIGKIIDFGKDPQEVPQIVVDFFEKFFEKYDDGSLDMNLYHNNAERNRVDKTNFLESVSTLNGYLRDKTSITNPSIIIEMSEFPTFNYVYLPKFNRYYYVTNILSIATNLWQIDMHVDVLMSYKDKILLQSAIIERNEYEWEPYLIDSSLPVSKEPNITVEEVPQSIINTTYGDDDMYTFFLEVVG